MAPITNRVLGLGFAFLNTVLSSVGFVLQRKAQLMKDRQMQNYQPMWLLGVILYIAAALPDVVAYTLIPQVLCATVGCFRLVMVCLLGHVFLGEHLARKDAQSISLCTLGTILCVVFGPGNDERVAVSPSEFHHPKVAVYTAVALGLLFIFLIIAHADSLGWIMSDSKLYRYALPLATALAYGAEKVYNTELGFLKMPQDVLEEPLWLCTVSAIALLGLTDFYLNMRAAARLPVHLFVPLSFAFGTSLQCFQGMVIFDEFVGMSPFCNAMTLVGSAFSLIAALMIQPPHFDARDRAVSAQSQAALVSRSRDGSGEPAADAVAADLESMEPRSRSGTQEQGVYCTAGGVPTQFVIRSSSRPEAQGSYCAAGNLENEGDALPVPPGPVNRLIQLVTRSSSRPEEEAADCLRSGDLETAALPSGPAASGSPGSPLLGLLAAESSSRDSELEAELLVQNLSDAEDEALAKQQQQEEESNAIQQPKS